MTVAKYSFTKSVDVPRLEKEINASGITIKLDHISTSGTSVDVYFKDSLPNYDLLVALVTAHVNIPLPPESTPKYTAEGALLMDVALPKGLPGSSGVTFVTHDFSDRTTWYQRSVRVADETLTLDNTGTVESAGCIFSSAHPWWVNIRSPRMTFHKGKVIKKDGSYAYHSEWEPVVKVGGVVAPKGSYDVDYELGKVVFLSAPSGIVTASYSHNDGVVKPSEWLLVTPAGKDYVIAHVENQFDKMTTYTTPIRFEVWAGSQAKYGGYAAYGSFADTMPSSPFMQMQVDYKDIRSVINQGNLGTGYIPAMPNAGTTQDIVVMPFDYIKAIVLKSSQYAVVRVWNIGDIPHETSCLATASFYIEASTAS
jgi:hypothetical protein